ncbi:MAG: hypothetical protein NVS3B5_09200 [Sphingomicrobium sp.]
MVRRSPNVRARAIDVASRWTQMAEQLEWVEEQSQIRLDAASQAREHKRRDE